MDLSSVLRRRCKIFQYRNVAILLGMIFMYHVGRLYSPCDNSVRLVLDDTQAHSDHRHPYRVLLLRDQDQNLDNMTIHNRNSHLGINEESNYEPSNLDFAKDVSKKPLLTAAQRKAEYLSYKHRLYVPKDYYGTGGVEHHVQLKKLGLESTSKHHFKSPYIFDPHIYHPKTIRKAPGTREKKIITCFNCPERFYISNNLNNDFKMCPWSECELTKTPQFNPDASVMIFWQDPETMPPHKPKGQVWAWMSWESPPHRPYPTNEWRGKFNWTITYRQDADFSLPYNGLAWRDENLLMSDEYYLKMAKMKTKTAAWWVSHCETRAHREHYVKEMKKYIDVDVFGACTNKTCDRGYHDDCFAKLNDTYRFYLSFENSYCTEYVTEKFFNMFRFRYSIIPVGRSAFDYDKYMPPDTFVNAEHFGSAKELAEYLKELGNDHKRYAQMLKEKDRLASLHRKMDWCDFCEKLHTGKFKNRVIDNLQEFTNEGGKCWDKVVKDPDAFRY